MGISLPRHWRYDPERKPTERRPQPQCTHPSLISDKEVAHLAALVDSSGVLELIDQRLGPRPGPDGMAPRTILVGLLLALKHRGSARLDDASELLHQSLRPRSRELLGIEALVENDHDGCQMRAAYARCTRAFDAITTGFDPMRHNRRKRLSRPEAETVLAAWTSPINAEVVDKLSELANLFIHATVRVAEERGMLRHWPGDIGVDDTPALTWGRPPSRRRGPLDIGAGKYRKGGKKDKLWAYALMLALTGHADPDAAGRYPQLCLGMQIHQPNKVIGNSAIKVLTAIEGLAFIKRFLAGDRAFTHCYAEDFQIPARALGYQLVLDYEVRALGYQGDTHGAYWRGGQLYCPALPDHLMNAGKLLRKSANEQEIAAGRKLVLEAEKYRFQTKEGRRADGSWRAQCPASGTSPTVTCPRVEARGRNRPEATFVDLSKPRSRNAHPAAKHRVQPENTPRSQWPKCCSQSSITVLAEDNARFAQFFAHGTPEWETAYRSIRAQTEGGNGWMKANEIDIGSGKLRKARGRVAQTILIAMSIMVANLRRLEQFLRNQHVSPATLLDHLLPQPPANLDPQVDPPSMEDKMTHRDTT